MGARSQEGRGRRAQKTPITCQRFAAAAQRLCAGKQDNGQTPTVRLVTELLAQDVCYNDMESAHQYADHLEELVPLVADDAYLRAVLTYELAGGDPGEPIKLSRVADEAALQDIRSTQQDPGSLATPLLRDEVAESLSLLYKIRADHLRHERLMAKLRGAHHPYLAGLIVIPLGLLALAILSNGNPPDASALDAWAQLLAVAAAGALGSVLAATFRLRDTVQLSPLRSIVAITFIQPLIGASFGLMSWLILTSGLVTIGGRTAKHGRPRSSWPSPAASQNRSS